jgi:predicted alpha/beta-hydrolase family hydrolase
MTPRSETKTKTVTTPQGEARVHWHRARRATALLALGHGAGGGIESADLRALAEGLPARGITVALVEQPWRVAGKRLAPAPRTLDAAWTALWPELARPGLPVVAGGRSAGARVACRTGRALGARAVLALSFPLHPPGRPEKSRAAELRDAGVPVLVVQGTRDPFGTPGEFPSGTDLIEVDGATHALAVPDAVAERVAAWLRRAVA